MTRVHNLLTPIDDNVLDDMVTQIRQRLPNCGYKMMTGFLNAQGIRIQSKRLVRSFEFWFNSCSINNVGQMWLYFLGDL